MAETNEGMVKELIDKKLIKSGEVKRAFLEVDRKSFVPAELSGYAYTDQPLHIGEGQTISAPHIVAMMTKNLDLNRDSNVLEIGTGSGYQAAILSRIAYRGKINTVEIRESLFKEVMNQLRPYSNVFIHRADGSEGLVEEAPFDRIISTCGVPEVPHTWRRQLKNRGIIIAPVGGSFHQRLMKYTKEEGSLVEEDLGVPCVFVPLIGKYGFKKK